MTDKNERGGLHDPALKEEEAAARFSIEDILGQVARFSLADILEQVEEQTGLGDIVGREGEPMATKKQIAANRKNSKRSTGPRTRTGKARSALNATRHGLLREFHLVDGEDPQEFSKFAEGIRADLKPEGAVEESLVERIIRDTWRLNRLDSLESALLLNEGALDDLSISEALNLLRFFSEESGRRFDRLFEEFKFLINNERNMQTLAQNKLDAGSIGESQLAGAAKFARLTDERNSLESIFVKNLIARLAKAAPAATKARSIQTAAEANRAEGERSAQSAKASINAAMARAFVRNQGRFALLLRYRTKIQQSLENERHELQRLQAARQGHVVPPPEVVDVNVNFTGRKENKD